MSTDPRPDNYIPGRPFLTLLHKEVRRFLRVSSQTVFTPIITASLYLFIFGATLGTVGFGRIGQAVARRARGFHMNVLAVRSPGQSLESPEFSETAGIDGEASDIPPVRFVDLPTALAQSDFVSLHVPLTFRTQHMIGEPEFQAWSSIAARYAPSIPLLLCCDMVLLRLLPGPWPWLD